MSSNNFSVFNEMLPKNGQLYHADFPTVVLCKPKIMPLKSITLEKLNDLQEKNQNEIKEQVKDKEEIYQH